MDIEMLYSDWLKLAENFDKSIYSRKNGSFGVNSERLKSSHPSSIKGTKCTDQPMYTLSGFQCWSCEFFNYIKIAISNLTNQNHSLFSLFIILPLRVNTCFQRDFSLGEFHLF